MDSQWHTPKAPGSRSMQTLNLKLSDVQFQPAFGHIPLIHTATQLIKASRAPVAVNDQQPIPIAVPIAESAAPATPLTETLSETLASPLSATSDLAPHLSIASAASVASTVAAASVASVTVARAAAAHTHAPFRPSCMHVTADIESLAGALVDDRYGHPIEVMAVRLQVRLCPVHCMPCFYCAMLLSTMCYTSGCDSFHCLLRCCFDKQMHMGLESDASMQSILQLQQSACLTACCSATWSMQTWAACTSLYAPPVLHRQA